MLAFDHVDQRGRDATQLGMPERIFHPGIGNKCAVRVSGSF